MEPATTETCDKVKERLKLFQQQRKENKALQNKQVLPRRSSTASSTSRCISNPIVDKRKSFASKTVKTTINTVAEKRKSLAKVSKPILQSSAVITQSSSADSVDTGEVNDIHSRKRTSFTTCDDVRLVTSYDDEDDLSMEGLGPPTSLRFSLGDSDRQELLQLDQGEIGDNQISNETAVIQEEESSAVVASTSVTINQIDGEPLHSVSFLKPDLGRRVNSKTASQSPSQKMSIGLEGDKGTAWSCDIGVEAVTLRDNSMSTGGEISLATLLGFDKDVEDEEEQCQIPTDAEAVSSATPLSVKRFSRKSTAIKVKQAAYTRVTLPVDAGRGKGRAARRVNIGATDIFSDDEDDNADQVKGACASSSDRPSVQQVVSSRKRERAEMVTSRGEIDTRMGALVSLSGEDTGGITGAMDLRNVHVEETVVPHPKKHRSILRKTAVTFSFDQIDQVTDTLKNTGIASANRHSRRLSGAGSGTGSAKKIQAKRKGTPRALPADRPRFSRPSNSEGSSNGSEEAMETEDEERSDFGYGSYFSSMMAIQQVDDDDFDLLAATPVIRRRRSRRLSASAGKRT